MINLTEYEVVTVKDSDNTIYNSYDEEDVRPTQILSPTGKPYAIRRLKPKVGFTLSSI